MNPFRQWPALVVAGLVAVTGAGVVHAAEKPASDGHGLSALDRHIYQVLRKVHNRGADLYNSGDAAGCYRVLQGMLETLQPLLSDHPDVQKTIAAGLAEAERSSSTEARAYALHEVIVKVRRELKPGGHGTAGRLGEKPHPDPGEQPADTSGEKRAARTGTVLGMVTFQGQPLTGGEITFVSDKGKKPASYSGLIKADGSYELTGVKTGTYRVAIVSGVGKRKTAPPGKPAKQVAIPLKYGVPNTSGLTMEVLKGRQTHDFELAP